MITIGTVSTVMIVTMKAIHQNPGYLTSIKDMAKVISAAVILIIRYFTIDDLLK